MAPQLSDALAAAALNETERRAVARIVGLLEGELGDDLLAVWLYGSRARGEADPSETDPDLRSDIDMIAIVDPRRDVRAFDWDFMPKLIDAVDAEGDSPPYYSLRFYDADYLRDRRRIRSFFFQEVDRDKIVLAGGDLEGDEYPPEGSADKAMQSVSCASSTSCVAVGEAASKPVAATWNGTS